MGRLESLTALALGRGPYEDSVVEWTGDENLRHNGQLYNEHGHPRNPETRRREREAVRAANEVMQATGVVEDAKTALIKAKKAITEKHKETFTGLRLMEVGRAALVGGVWGVLGLRRRILLYRPYGDLLFFQILQQEKTKYGLLHVIGAGFPAVCAYHVADWASFTCEIILDALWDEEGKNKASPGQLQMKKIIQKVLDFGFCYITLHFRMFAVLQQLNVVSSSHLLPTLGSIIPFLEGPPLLFPVPTLRGNTIFSASLEIIKSATPLFLVLLHGRAKFIASQILYRPIYKSLPRPTGDSMFGGLQISPPTMEYDTPDQPLPNHHPSSSRTEDEPTLRALEGLPDVERTETRTRPAERDSDSGADDGELTHPTLISFDVEANDGEPQDPAIEAALGHWSAELRSANEPPTDERKYHVTGLTMLPTIMATEGLREIAAGIIVMPIEAFMVRSIGRLYRTRLGLGMDDMYSWWSPVRLPSLQNICWALVLQLGITGVFWTGFTVVSQWAIISEWAVRQREAAQKKNEEKENNTAGRPSRGSTTD
ncbi:hypothetical protein LOCC1_G006079 [Lachnellula occidentalis]|uniref:Uncharacterized protein n=1 Tax=Lachnellula occidentalis TaxID=215460 RepID=A0A8H8RQG1_9HELO|nr:hypothetical protein LOCC1_G006079 [Lachnellula occidentalis]